MKVIATLCYIIKDDKVLLVHRNKKRGDAHKGKYNGLGGKSELGEDPHTCVVREIKEETGLSISPIYCGNMTFGGFGKNKEDWEVHIFKVTQFDGELIDCPEGTLEWCAIDDFLAGKFPIWQSDNLFVKHVFVDGTIFIGVADYTGGEYRSGSMQIYKR